jgi:hypothetical protein
LFSHTQTGQVRRFFQNVVKVAESKDRCRRPKQACAFDTLKIDRIRAVPRLVEVFLFRVEQRRASGGRVFPDGSPLDTRYSILDHSRPDAVDFCGGSWSSAAVFGKATVAAVVHKYPPDLQGAAGQTVLV